MTETSDVELLERWSGGDARAGEVLAGRYFMPIRGYFLNKAPSEHEDLVQEVFVRLASKRASFRGQSSFRSFIFGVARMVLLEHLRAKKNKAERFDPLEHSVADLEGGRMSSLMASGESKRLVLDALRELPFNDQEILELYYWQKLTAGEIAQMQALPERTVRSRVRAALKRASAAYAKLAAAPQVEEEEDGDDAQLVGWLEELRTELGSLTVILAGA